MTPVAPATAQVASPVFSCSCTKDASGPFCASCKAARRDDCVCNANVQPLQDGEVTKAADPPPSRVQCAARARLADATKAGEALDAVKADVKKIQQAHAGYEARMKKARSAIRDFEENNKRDCKATLAELMSEAEIDQAKQNHDKLQEMSACTLSSLRSDIEVLKRTNITSSRVAKQLTDVNGLIKDIEPLRFAMIDEQTRSANMKDDVRSITSQCK